MLNEPARPPAPRDAFPAELLVWLSPSFPTGAFAYSQGLERAVADGLVTDADSLTGWLGAVVAHGSLRNDLVLASLALRAETAPALRAIAELAAALQPCAERHAEAIQLGGNFRAAVLAGWPELAAAFSELGDMPPTLPVAVAVAARGQNLPLAATLEAFAHAYIANAVSAAIRLSVIGQFDGVRVQAALAEPARKAARFAADATEDDLGSATFAADLASIRHETQAVRLFRS